MKGGIGEYKINVCVKSLIHLFHRLGLVPIRCGELPSAGERDGEIFLGEPPLDENVPLSLETPSLDAPHARSAFACPSSTYEKPSKVDVLVALSSMLFKTSWLSRK